MKGRMPLSISD